MCIWEAIDGSIFRRPTNIGHLQGHFVLLFSYLKSKSGRCIMCMMSQVCHNPKQQFTFVFLMIKLWSLSPFSDLDSDMVQMQVQFQIPKQLNSKLEIKGQTHSQTRCCSSSRVQTMACEVQIRTHLVFVIQDFAQKSCVAECRQALIACMKSATFCRELATSSRWRVLLSHSKVGSWPINLSHVLAHQFWFLILHSTTVSADLIACNFLSWGAGIAWERPIPKHCNHLQHVENRFRCSQSFKHYNVSCEWCSGWKAARSAPFPECEKCSGQSRMLRSIC